MDKSTIETMYAYNDWANDRLIEALNNLPESDYMRDLPGRTSSIRNAFAHIVAAEWLWLMRWKGKHPAEVPEWVAEGSFTILTEQLHETRAERNALLRKASGDELEAVLKLAGQFPARVSRYMGYPKFGEQDGSH